MDIHAAMETNIDVWTYFNDNAQMVAPQSAAAAESSGEQHIANGRCVVATGGELTLSPSSSRGSALNTSPLRTSDTDRRIESFTHQNSDEHDTRVPRGMRF